MICRCRYVSRGARRFGTGGASYGRVVSPVVARPVGRFGAGGSRSSVERFGGAAGGNTATRPGSVFSVGTGGGNGGGVEGTDRGARPSPLRS